MSVGGVSPNPYFQYMKQIQGLAQQSIQALNTSRESSTDSIIRRAGEGSVKNQETVVVNMQQKDKAGRAMDIFV